jgi:hypothetical protein
MASADEGVAMTLSIELSPDAERKLGREAGLHGVTPEQYAKDLIERGLPAGAPAEGSKPDDKTLELFARWEEEDRTDDPHEIARRIQEFEDFKRTINETREQAGARKIYP